MSQVIGHLLRHTLKLIVIVLLFLQLSCKKNHGSDGSFDGGNSRASSYFLSTNIKSPGGILSKGFKIFPKAYGLLFDSPALIGATVRIFAISDNGSPVGEYLASGITDENGHVDLSNGGIVFGDTIGYALFITDVSNKTQICLMTSLTKMVCDVDSYAVGFFLKSVAAVYPNFKIKNLTLESTQQLIQEARVNLVTPTSTSDAYESGGLLSSLVTKFENQGNIPVGSIATEKISEVPPTLVSANPSNFKKTAYQGAYSTLSVQAQDFKSRDLVYRWSSSGISITTSNSSSNNFTFILNPTSDTTNSVGSTGTVSVAIQNADQNANQNKPVTVVNFLVTVAAQQMPPIFDNNADGIADSVVVSNSVSVSEGTPLGFFVTASDANGDIIEYNADCLPAGSTFVTNPYSASYRQFSWTPDFSLLTQSAPSSVFFARFSIRDSNGVSAIHPFPIANQDCSNFEGLTSSSAITVVKINVLNSNRVPTFAEGNEITQKTKKGGRLSFSVTPQDPDPEDQLKMFCASVSGKDICPYFDGSTGSFNWVTGNQDEGVHIATIKVCDNDSVCGVGNQSTLIVTLTVGNSQPIFANVFSSSYSVSEAQKISFDFIATDADAGDLVTYACVPIAISGNGRPCENLHGSAFSWTPNNSNSGVYEFEIVASDNAGACGVDSVCRASHESRLKIVLKVMDTNGPPVLTDPGLLMISESKSLTFTLSAVDPDLGDVIHYELVSGQPAGSRFDPVTGTFTWTPDFNAGNGKPTLYPVIFRACDLKKNCSPDLASKIVVNNTNRIPSKPTAPKSSYSVSEGKTITFTLNSSTDPDGDEIVYSAVLPNGASFSSANRTFVWTPDFTMAGSCLVTFTASDPSLGSSSLGIPITVLEATQPSIALSAATGTVAENTPTYSAKVVLSAALGITATVNYGTSKIDATPDLDYVATKGTLVFSPGQTSKAIPVSILDDNLYEPTEKFSIVLLDPTIAKLGAVQLQSVGITNNDSMPVITFSTSTSSVSENSGIYVANVKLSVASAVSAGFSYSTLAATAGSDGDFKASSGTIYFEPGETMKTIYIPIQDDAIYEAAEKFTIKLANAVNAKLGTSVIQTVTIVDNDTSPIVGFDISKVAVSEDIGTYVATVTLSQVAETSVSVSYTTESGTALSGKDFTTVKGALVFAPGQTQKTVGINITNDKLFEVSEDFDLVLSTNGSIGLGEKFRQTISITDNDSKPSVGLASATASVLESGGSYSATVKLTAAAGVPVSVIYKTDNVNATADVDYVAQTGTITFAPGEVSKVVSIPLLGDNIYEAAETFKITLSDPTESFLGIVSIQTVTITDDDKAPIVSFDKSLTDSNENSGTILIPVILNSVSATSATVKYTFSNITAQNGIDYSGVNGTLVYAPGETTKYISVTIKGDSTNDPKETFKVSLGSYLGCTVGTIPVNTVTIW